MGLEIAPQYVEDLNIAWPIGSVDLIANGDEHIRNLKRLLTNHLLSGLDASKPTTGFHINRFYGSTDGKKLYWDDGTQLIELTNQTPTISPLLYSGFHANNEGVTPDQTVANNIVTKINYTNELFDKEPDYDATNSVWTPKRVGMCHVDCSIAVDWDSGNARTKYEISLHKNGVAWMYSPIKYTYHGGSVQALGGSFTFYNANANADSYDIRLKQSNGSTEQIKTYVGNTWFAGFSLPVLAP
jgi:hypothetical protein